MVSMSSMLFHRKNRKQLALNAESHSLKQWMHVFVTTGNSLTTAEMHDEASVLNPDLNN